MLEKFEAPPLPIHIVYPTSRLLSAKVRTFIDLVVEISDWHFGGDMNPSSSFRDTRSVDPASGNPGGSMLRIAPE